MNHTEKYIEHIKDLPGQIKLNTSFGRIIYDLVLTNNFETIVDVGTWNGMGTTLCILKALEKKHDFSAAVYTIELYKEILHYAKINLAKYIDKFNLKILHGKLVELEDVYNWFDHSLIDLQTDGHAKLWYHKDMELLKKAPNVLHLLPDKIDLLILDGGEYSTYPEWQKLKNRCRFFCLDDTNIHKCSKIKSEIINSSDYTVIYDMTNERNGFLVGYKNV